MIKRLFEYLLNKENVFENIDRVYYAHLSDMPGEFEYCIERYSELFPDVCVYDQYNILEVVVPEDIYDRFNPFIEICTDRVCDVYTKYTDEYACFGIIDESVINHIVTVNTVFNHSMEIGEPSLNREYDFRLKHIRNTKYAEPCEVIFPAVAYYTLCNKMNMSFIVPVSSLAAYICDIYRDKEVETTITLIENYLKDYCMYSVNMINGVIQLNDTTDYFFKLYKIKGG